MIAVDNGAQAGDRLTLGRQRPSVFPGLDGIPFRLHVGQDVPDIREDDPQHRRPQDVMDARARVFDTSSPDDLKAYNDIVDMVAKGRAAISAEDRAWSDKRDAFVIFLRWVEFFLEIPGGQYDGQGK